MSYNLDCLLSFGVTDELIKTVFPGVTYHGKVDGYWAHYMWEEWGLYFPTNSHPSYFNKIFLHAGENKKPITFRDYKTFEEFFDVNGLKFDMFKILIRRAVEDLDSLVVLF